MFNFIVFLIIFILFFRYYVKKMHFFLMIISFLFIFVSEESQEFFCHYISIHHLYCLFTDFKF